MFVPKNKFAYLKHVSLLSQSVNYSPKRFLDFAPKFQSNHSISCWTFYGVRQLRMLNNWQLSTYIDRRSDVK